ncbi:flagellar biosynthesis protein FlgH [Enterobacter hormaechei]|uniref:PAAR domain-containing protein n=1 Tax=Enterobacter hormaechei TaxID=158836 RepID=UPI001C708128|nr:PAAR domain-containing protein [Enterobacter hormaechei]MBW9413075.1 flagellar biosynthesis protein FlgH [Enterobacter hormaechei]
MGQPAARATIDVSAHSGPIQSGSPDVIIGGFPAARKGDTLSCSTHGSGIIVGCSGTVFVNGMPLARQGDKTKCDVSGSPAPAIPKAAAPQYWGGTLAKNAGEDGMMHGEHFDARVLGAYASLEDKNLNGDFDTASAGFALADITIGNMKSKDLLRAEMRNKLAVANATGSLYGGGNDIYGLNANAAATGEQYGGSVAAGKEGTLYGGVSGDVTIGTAEAKAVLEVYTGNDGKYGLTADAGAEAKGVKGEVSGNLDILGIVSGEAKIDGSFGSAGLAGGGSAFWDTRDYSVNVRVTGGAAGLVGLKGDASLKVAFKPILDFFDYLYGEEDEPAVTSVLTESGDGTIITGCVTVLIGD